MNHLAIVNSKFSKTVSLDSCVQEVAGLKEEAVKRADNWREFPHLEQVSGKYELYLSLDKLERTSWSYTGHICNIVPQLGEARLVGDADAR